MTEPTDGHEHAGAWCAVVLTVAFVVALVGGTLAQTHQLRVIYDRVGEMQRQLECPLSEMLVTDHDGVEYCLDPAEKEETP